MGLASSLNYVCWLGDRSVVRLVIEKRYILVSVLVGMILIGVTFGLVQRSVDLHRLRQTAAINRAALMHLCTLQSITEVIWVSGIRSYTSLPNRTPDQTRLLETLKRSVAEIRFDSICPRIAKKGLP